MHFNKITDTALLVCQEDFERYEAVRRHGRFNMFSEEARMETGIDKTTYRAILSNYDILEAKWTKN